MRIKLSFIDDTEGKEKHVAVDVADLAKAKEQATGKGLKSLLGALDTFGTGILKKHKDADKITLGDDDSADDKDAEEAAGEGAGT